MKALLIICDGMGDRPIDSLGGKTPLEHFKNPNMDRLAELGINGIMYAISPGVRPGSDTAHLAILGYDPYEVYTGRGPFETLGCGIDIRPEDIGIRANFATVDGSMTVIDRRAGRIMSGTDELEKALNEITIESHPNVGIIFKASTAHRGALLVRGEGLSEKISDSDPHHEGVQVPKIEALAPEAQKTADVLNEFTERSHRILSEHPLNKQRQDAGKNPANIVLLRGAGEAPHIPDFNKRNNVKGACIAVSALIQGIAKYIGMDTFDVPGATGGPDSDFEAKFRKAIELLSGDYDFVFVHLKGIDETGHDADVEKRGALIERIDKALGYLLDKVKLNEIAVCLTCDHSTPVSVHDHSGDAVPIVIAGQGVRVDEVREFNERAATKGGLLHIVGKDILPLLTNLMGVQEKFGA